MQKLKKIKKNLYINDKKVPRIGHSREGWSTGLGEIGRMVFYLDAFIIFCSYFLSTEYLQCTVNCTMHCALYNVQCTIYKAPCTVQYSVYCTIHLCTIHRVIYNTQCTVQYTVYYTMHCVLYNKPCTVQ